jgi:hypothetical protein
VPGSKTNAGETRVLNVLFGASQTVPSTWHLGLHAVPRWRPNQAYTVGQFVTPTTSNPNRIYRCTTAGTSGASEPSWPDTDNATVSDGTVTWTEATNFLEAGTFPAEVSGGGYARVAVANNTTNFPATSNDTKSNGTDITFPIATADWGQIALVTIWDASTGGNAWFWATLLVFRDVLSGDQLRIPAGQLQIRED